MECLLNPVILLFIIWTLLAPFGIGLAIVKRKIKKLLITGIVLTAIGIPPWLIMGPFYLWKFDALVGWHLRMETEAPPYTVTLVQEPGCDFYNSTLEIKRPDGKVASVLLDCDDFRWWRPGAIQKKGKLYITRGSGKINERTTYIDPTNGIIYAGYYRRTNYISELEFRYPEGKKN